VRTNRAGSWARGDLSQAIQFLEASRPGQEAKGRAWSSAVARSATQKKPWQQDPLHAPYGPPVAAEDGFLNWFCLRLACELALRFPPDQSLSGRGAGRRWGPEAVGPGETAVDSARSGRQLEDQWRSESPWRCGRDGDGSSPSAGLPLARAYATCHRMRSHTCCRGTWAWGNSHSSSRRGLTNQERHEAGPGSHIFQAKGRATGPNRSFAHGRF